MLRFWGGGSAYVVWEGGGWSGHEEILLIYYLLLIIDYLPFTNLGLLAPGPCCAAASAVAQGYGGQVQICCFSPLRSGLC